MARKKVKRGVGQKKLLLLLPLFISFLVIGIITLLKSKKIDKVVSVSENIPTPGVISYPVDTKNDGVYVNYKYGYRLKYPNNFFKKSEQDDPNSAHFYTSENLSTPERGEMEKYPNDIFLSILSIGKDEFPFFQLQDIYDQALKYQLRVGILNSNYDVLFRNLEVGDLSDKKTAVNYHGPDLYSRENINKFKLDSSLSTAFPQIYRYSGVILTEKFGISISFASANKSLVNPNFVPFLQIVNSFETFDSQNTPNN